MSQNCQYSQYKKSGLEQSLFCSLTGKYCIKQRYCPTERRLVNTDDWRACTQLTKEGLQMANKKSSKKKTNNIASTKTVTKPVIEAKEVKVIAEEEPKTEKAENKVMEYEVILATPAYFIINKEGVNLTIKKQNNYKKGDMVSL